MNTLIRYGDGTTKTFDVPGSSVKVVFVNGQMVTPAAVGYDFVSLSAAPARGVPIDIEWGEVPTTAPVATVVIADNLTTADPSQVLSALQGTILKARVDALAAIDNSGGSVATPTAFSTSIPLGTAGFGVVMPLQVMSTSLTFIPSVAVTPVEDASCKVPLVSDGTSAVDLTQWIARGDTVVAEAGRKYLLSFFRRNGDNVVLVEKGGLYVATAPAPAPAPTPAPSPSPSPSPAPAPSVATRSATIAQADGLLAAPSDGGATWVQDGGSNGGVALPIVVSNKAVNNGGYQTNTALLDLGATDATTTITFTPLTGNPTAAGANILFRSNGNFSNDEFYLESGQYKYRTRNSGTYTDVAGPVAATMATGTPITMSVVCQGTSIVCKANGTAIFTLTDASGNNGTLFGFSVGSAENQGSGVDHLSIVGF